MRNSDSKRRPLATVPILGQPPSQLLERLVAVARTHKVFVLCTSRPARDLPGRGEGHVTDLRLAQLTRSECRLLVERLTTRSELTAEQIEAVLARADGGAAVC